MCFSIRCSSTRGPGSSGTGSKAPTKRYGSLCLSCPRVVETRLILDVEIDSTTAFQEKHLKSITHLYGKAPYFERYVDELSAVLRGPCQCLADLNIELISWLCMSMGIQTETLRSSCLNADGKRVDLLVAICKATGADCYISPEGSRGYIEENDLFALNDIDLVYHAYHHPEYRQINGDFLAYLSALDLLF